MEGTEDTGVGREVGDDMDVDRRSDLDVEGTKLTVGRVLDLRETVEDARDRTCGEVNTWNDSDICGADELGSGSLVTGDGGCRGESRAEVENVEGEERGEL